MSTVSALGGAITNTLVLNLRVAIHTLGGNFRIEPQEDRIKKNHISFRYNTVLAVIFAVSKKGGLKTPALNTYNFLRPLRLLTWMAPVLGRGPDRGRPAPLLLLPRRHQRHLSVGQPPRPRTPNLRT